MRLSRGDFYIPDQEFDVSRYNGRVWFLEAVAKEAPEVLCEVNANLLPLWRSAYFEFEAHLPLSIQAKLDLETDVKLLDGRPPAERLLRWDFISGFENPVLEALKSRLTTWGESFSLRDDWILELTADYLTQRVPEPDHDEPNAGWYPFIKYEGPVGKDVLGRLLTVDARRSHLEFQPQDITFAFEHDGWDPLRETWADIEKLIFDRFKTALAAYRESIEAKALRRGLRRTPRKSKADLHFKWLVTYQVKRQSFAQIARNQGVLTDTKTIEEAVKALAELIGLSLRPPSKGGRPRKFK